jgi:hypothetical protein
MEKSSQTVFSAAGPALHRPHPTPTHEASPLPHACLSRWQPGPSCRTFSSKSSLAACSLALRRNSRRCAVHPSPPSCRKDAHVCACHLESLRRLWCAVMSHHRCPLHCCRRHCASRVPAPTVWWQHPRTARSAGQAAVVESTPPRPLRSLATRA